MCHRLEASTSVAQKRIHEQTGGLMKPKLKKNSFYIHNPKLWMENDRKNETKSSISF